MLTQREYQRAILIQDACNLSGVVHEWSRVMKKIWGEANARDKGTDWVNNHPINVMYASKVASLTGCEIPETFSSSYHACLVAAELTFANLTTENVG